MIITIQVTIHSTTDLLRLQQALAPLLVNTAPQRGESTAPQPEESALCPIHQVPLRQFSKNGRSWTAHKTPEGWCNGK
jgi:hypothetical protein